MFVLSGNRRQSPEMIAAFRHLAEMDEEAWEEACRASVEMGKRRGLGNFVEGVERLKLL